MITFTTRMMVEELMGYREFDRVAKPAPKIPFVQCYDVDQVTEWVRLNGIEEPLELSIFDNKALLTNGNHRVVSASRLNMKDVPVTMTYYNDQELNNTFYDHTIQRFKMIL